MKGVLVIMFYILLFQIDALSKRSKASETAFLSIYKKLVDVPGIDYSEILQNLHEDQRSH